MLWAGIYGGPHPMKKPASKPRQRRVWVGIYKPDDDICTWSAARDRHDCRMYLEDVYSEEEVRLDCRIVRATLSLDPPKRAPIRRRTAK